MLSCKWRPIKGYEGKYEVSDTGIIKSVERTVSLGNKSRRVPEKYLKLRLDKYGYQVVELNDNGVKWFKVHRLVAINFIGDCKLTVNHKDFDKTNNNLSNLEFMTISDNLEHFNSKRKRNLPKGKDHHNYKLSNVDKIMINHMKKNGSSNYKISSIFNIHPQSVYKVIKHVG